MGRQLNARLIGVTDGESRLFADLGARMLAGRALVSLPAGSLSGLACDQCPGPPFRYG